MKFPHLLTIAITALLMAPLSAEQMKVPKAPAALTEAETSALYEQASTLLKQSVHIESKDKASSHFVRRGKFTRIEWRNLVFRQLILGTVSRAERKAGLLRRAYAQLDSDSYRLSDEAGTTEWRSGRCPGFPTYVMIEEVDGEFRVSAPNIQHFAPSSEQLAALPSTPFGGELVADNRF